MIRVVPLSDLHSGLRTSLMLPKFVEEDALGSVTHKPSKVQNWIRNKIWNKAHDQIFDGSADEVVILLMGDSIHGSNIKNHQEVWTTSLFAQADHFIQTVLPWVNKASQTYAVAGTRWHTAFNGDDIESYVSRQLGVFGKTAYHKMEVDIDGVRFALQHKGPKPGSRVWTKQNAMFHHLKNIVFECLKDGREPADVYLYGHFHEFLSQPYQAEGPWGSKTIWGYVLPSLCTPSEYALYNISSLELADVGLVWFDLPNIGDPALAFERFDAVKRVKHAS